MSTEEAAHTSGIHDETCIDIRSCAYSGYAAATNDGLFRGLRLQHDHSQIARTRHENGVELLAEDLVTLPWAFRVRPELSKRTAARPPCCLSLMPNAARDCDLLCYAKLLENRLRARVQSFSRTMPREFCPFQQQHSQTAMGCPNRRGCACRATAYNENI
jgi:hypothetical protein